MRGIKFIVISLSMVLGLTIILELAFNGNIVYVMLCMIAIIANVIIFLKEEDYFE